MMQCCLNFYYEFLLESPNDLILFLDVQISPFVFSSHFLRAAIVESVDPQCIGQSHEQAV